MFFLTIIQYHVLEHVASMYAAALAQTDRSLHHHHGYSRCHTDMDIHPSTEKMMHQGLSGFIQKLKELFNIIFWFPELKFLNAFSNHYIQWCRCHVVIITCRKLHCQEKPWPPKNSSFKMLIFPYTLLYIVHVSTNPLLLTMTLWEVTITDNCCHWKNRKKLGSYD